MKTQILSQAFLHKIATLFALACTGHWLLHHGVEWAWTHFSHDSDAAYRTSLLICAGVAAVMIAFVTGLLRQILQRREFGRADPAST